MAAENPHENHRLRMDEKIRQSGLEYLPEHEQLEVLLYAVVPRANTNEIAHELLKKFGSLSAVLHADMEELSKVKGVGTAVARFLHIQPALLGIVQRSLFGVNPILRTAEDCCAYVKTLFYDKNVETCMLVSLTSKRQVICFDTMAEGTPDESAIYIRNVVKTALRNQAHSVILAHNHPGGRCEPSHADVHVTLQLCEALQTVGIPLIDHIIFAEGETFSLRAHHFFE